MHARSLRGGLTVANIVDAVEESHDLVLEAVQYIIDCPEYDIPDEAVSEQNVVLLQRLQAYYGNQYPFLVGLWGAMRVAYKQQKSNLRMAMCDYLERAVSACSKKYDAASRILTGYQIIADEGRKARTWTDS